MTTTIEVEINHLRYPSGLIVDTCTLPFAVSSARTARWDRRSCTSATTHAVGVSTGPLQRYASSRRWQTTDSLWPGLSLWRADTWWWSPRRGDGRTANANGPQCTPRHGRISAARRASAAPGRRCEDQGQRHASAGCAVGSCRGDGYFLASM